LVAWADDDSTEEIEGFQEREEMTFLYWDADRQFELIVDHEVIEGDETFTIDGTTVVGLTVIPGLMIVLEEGWNLVSSNYSPRDPDLRNLLESVLDVLILIKDGSGQFSWIERNFWWLVEWVDSRGYKIKVSDNTILNIIGDPIPSDTEIPLPEGWSMIAYYPNQLIPDAEVAFANIIDILIIAKNGWGEFFCPQWNVNNMRDLGPGQGFQVKVREPGDHIWNEDDEGMDYFERVIPPPLMHFNPVLRTADNMSILVKEVPLSGDGVELGCFNNSDLCVGAVSLANKGPWGFAVWEDDQTTDQVDGLLNDQPLSFRLWDGEKDMKVYPKGELPVVYSTDGLSIITFDTESPVPVEFGLSQPYPNPFNSSVLIKFSLDYSADMQVGIYDLSGRSMITLAQEYLPAGKYYRVWDASNMASGIYFVRLTTGNRSRTVKMMLIR